MKITLNPIRVSHYTEVEGGEWKELQFDYRIPDDLSPLLPPIKTIRIAEGMAAHSLKTVDGRIWDAINGFRKEIGYE